MSSRLMNVAAVWQAALDDPEVLKNVPPGARNQYDRLVSRLPSLLGELLRDGANVKTVLQTRVRLLAHAEDQAFAYYFTKDYPSDSKPSPTHLRIAMERRISNELQECRELLEGEAYRDLKGYASDYELFQRHPLLTLNQAALVEYRACTLTIARLFVVQPALFLKF